MLDSRFWKKYFEVYDVLNLLIPYQELLETICDELDIKPGEKILEAGCGTGNLALKIKERGAEVIGLDNCKEALEIYKKKDPKAKVVLADLREKLPFPDNYFDKIASNNTLYAIPKEKQLDTLKEFYRILKPGGKIVISNPKKSSNPLKIYFKGIKQSLKQRGSIKTFKKMLLIIIPTLKMFYYNRKILKNNKHHFLDFFDYDEQKKLLDQTGFINISETELVYAQQVFLNSGFKPLI
jgi:ubiquinone/menaquinone biosynthesis C-methylase UbiE